MQKNSMKHHLTETHEHNFKIHNIALSSQSISLSECRQNIVGYRICNLYVIYAF